MGIRKNEIICGNSLEVLKELPSCSVNMCVTSPPYYRLRDYCVEGQIGLEETPEEYIKRLTEIFREVRRVLCDDGTLWLNIADSYAGSGRGAWSKPISERQKCKNSYLFHTENEAVKMPNTWDGIKPKDMIGIPWMLAFALRNDGWYLRSDIIWHKTNALPENVKDRPTKSYEHLFLFSKSQRYYYDGKAISEPISPVTVERYKRGVSDKNKYADDSSRQRLFQGRDNSLGMNAETRNKRDVWSISTNTYRMEKHFAMFPEKLVEPCILAGSKSGGIVLDPFFGSGTTGAVAVKLGRAFLGIDLNPEYCEVSKKRINEIKPL